MDIQITQALLNERVLIQHMMELYLYDFTEFDGADLDEQGLYGYEYLDRYWVEPERVPLIIRVDDKPAGFVLVLEHSFLGNQGKMIAEFFVMRKYRRSGVGRAAAFAVFDRFPGHWEVSEISHNTPAQQFWRKVIAQYTGGQYQEVVLDNETWQGPVQIFDNEWAEDQVSG